MDAYLHADPIIDHTHPAVAAKAAELAVSHGDIEAVARACFTFVRDQIRHSWDWRCGPVTCTASEVLLHSTGFCYAKSHLLCALLRANDIPAGLCYQRLRLEPGADRFCLHGLNSVLLPGHGWYRIDARGNKKGVEAEFSPPVERLAFTASERMECDLPVIYPVPLPQVVAVLQRCRTIEQVNERLPDLEH